MVKSTTGTPFYHGGTAWQAYGTRLRPGMTAGEAEARSGLSFRVETGPVKDGDGRLIANFRVVTRSDTRDHLGIVGPKYRVVQNSELFALNEALIGEGKAMVESAGALRGGRRVWILSRIPGEMEVAKDDPVGKFLLWTTRHDGKSSLWGLVTPIRFACENALQRAMRSAGKHRIAIRHTENVKDKIEEARRVLGLSLSACDTWGEEAQALARKSVGPKALAAYFRDLVPDPPKGVDPTRARGARRELQRLFAEGRGNDLPSVRGTLWAAVNAVADFVDHERPTRRRSAGRGPEIDPGTGRFESAIFGTGSRLKTRAWDLALKLS